jgi:orotate phosphoribosyltransferase
MDRKPIASGCRAAGLDLGRSGAEAEAGSISKGAALMDTLTATTDAARARLIEIVRRRSYGTGVQIKLASGRMSDFYFNLKPTMMDPEGSALIGRLVHDALASEAVDAVGGLEMGAVPIATCVATISHLRGRPLPAFFVRKQTKEHGTKSLVEGLVKGETLAGKTVVILEDVTTTGGSALTAIEQVRADGASIASVITIVDREEGAAEAFAAAGIRFRPILTRRMFL